jgi:hypothetical protein
MCHCDSFLAVAGNRFWCTYVLRVQYKMAHRNSNLEGTDNGQMTLQEYPNT